MARSRPRRLLIAVILLALVSLAGGVAYLLGVGRSRTDPFRQADAAFKAGNVAEAESQLRVILESDASNVRARALLIQILTGSSRVSEAEELARYWLDDPETEVFGFRALSQLAFRRNDALAAIRFARMIAERDPAFSQSMLVQVQDLVGTPADREGSVRAAEGLGLLAKAPEVRAGAFLYAAETLRGLERTLPDGPQRASYAQRRERNRQEARKAASTRDSLNAPLREPLNTTKARMGRIQLLSTDPSDQQRAVETLEELLRTDPELHEARVALVDHFVADGSLEKAAAHARLLKSGPAMLSMRAVSALAGAGSRAAALEVLGDAVSISEKVRSLLRCRILIGGDATEREEGAQGFERMVRESPSDDQLAREAYTRIRDSGDPDRALRMLEDAATREPRLRLFARVEGAAAASERGNSGETEARLTDAAAAAESSDLVGVFSRLRQAPNAGESTAFTFLAKALHAKKVDPNEVRLLRAAATAARTGAAPDGRGFDAWTRDDLGSIAADSGATIQVLAQAAMLAVVAEERHLLGRLLARILTQATDNAHAVTLFARAIAESDDGVRGLAADGMRSVAAEAGAPVAWLTTLADALMRGDATAIRRRHGDAPPASDRPQPTETLLQLALALRSGDGAEAEAHARALLAAAQGSPAAKERLGAVLLLQRKFDDVLALHAGATITPLQRAQRIQALQALDRGKDAVAEARLLVRESEGGDGALVLLGQLLREKDPDAALAALSSAAGQLTADALRAEILAQRGQEDAAVQVYEDMLRASGNRSLPAWQGLARVRAAQDRDGQFVQRVTSTIDAPPRGMRTVDVAALVRLRGQANERGSAYEQALKDYLRVLEVVPKDVVALNNAAWLMCDKIVRRAEDEPRWLEKALDLADRAVAAAPGVAAVHHTRARALVALGRSTDALEAFERAVTLTAAGLESLGKAGAPAQDIASVKGRLAKYLVDEAGLLEKTGATDRAKSMYRRIRDEHPGTYPAKVASEALTRMGE